MATVDYFLRVDGIDGESTAAQFAGWIDVESFSWGVTNTGSLSSGGGGGAGKAVPLDFVIVKRVDKASPKLFLACATGKHIKEVRLVSRRGGSNQAYLQYKLEDVLISSFKDAGSGGELPLEEVSMSYGRIEISYAPTMPNGQIGQPITAGFDFVQQRT